MALRRTNSPPDALMEMIFARPEDILWFLERGVTGRNVLSNIAPHMVFPVNIFGIRNVLFLIFEGAKYSPGL